MDVAQTYEIDLGPTDTDRPLQLSPDEEKILALYDQLEKLRLEAAIIKAQKAHISKPKASISPEHIQQAQERLLHARSHYTLHKEVVDGVLSMYPILKTVHQGTFSSPIERDIAPHLVTRDEAAVEIAKKSTDIRAILDELIVVQSEALKLSRQNVTLASEMLKLADKVNRLKEEPLVNVTITEEIQKLQESIKSSRQKWLVIKGTTSAVVAGSGVDWSQDPELTEIVLDPKEEM